MKRVACSCKLQVHFSLLPLLSASPRAKLFHLAACEGDLPVKLLLLWETMLQSTIFILPFAGLCALGKKLPGRTWENACGSLCAGALTCWEVLVTTERGSIAEGLLRLTGCPTSPFNRAWLSSDGWDDAPDGKERAEAGSCKLQGCVPAHLSTCPPAQSLPAPRPQHLVEKGHNGLW